MARCRKVRWWSRDGRIEKSGGSERTRPALRRAYRFFDDLRPPLRDPFFFGTFAPASRASERPIAIACLRLLTRLPDRPLFSVPRLRSCIARSTFSPAFFPYLAMHTLHPRRAAACVFYPEPPNPRTLRSVANAAPRLDVARHAADREARLIAEASGKFDEAMGVSEVADETERHADGARALAAAARHEIEKFREVHVPRVERQRGAHVFFGDALGRLA